MKISIRYAAQICRNFKCEVEIIGTGDNKGYALIHHPAPNLVYETVTVNIDYLKKHLCN